jgi:hypothetical protein
MIVYRAIGKTWQDAKCEAWCDNMSKDALFVAPTYEAAVAWATHLKYAAPKEKIVKMEVDKVRTKDGKVGFFCHSSGVNKELIYKRDHLGDWRKIIVTLWEGIVFPEDVIDECIEELPTSYI